MEEAPGRVDSKGDTSTQQTFHPMLKWTLVSAFFAPGTKETFNPGWCLQPEL